jgi:polyphosphate kinase
MPRELIKTVRKQLGLGKVDMIAGGNRHNFSDFFDFPSPAELKSGHYPPMRPLPHPALEGKTDLFELISSQDRILHFPYQKFVYVEELIWQAARDHGVKSIKISLYRTAKRSGLTDALLEALKQGKEVTLFIEAQARFDEENNLKWGRKFEKKGATVHYSIRHIKVHSKILLIERLESEQLRRYAYIGTGNFNAKTAKFYCDHALLTAHKGITADLSQVFKVLQRELIAPKLKHLLVAPFTARTTFEELIMQEIRHARHGLPAAITAKMNSLEDKRMIDRLYEASQAGVRIRLLVRGLCCLVPGIDGLSENIEVTSIVDRFLEHGRLYLFHNNGSELLYMGSADWMTRNLDKRVEVLTPILDPSVGEELKAILDLQLRDNVKARIIDAFACNDYVDPMGIEVPLRSQFAIYDYLGGN